MKMYDNKMGNKAMYGRPGRSRMGKRQTGMVKSPAQVRSRAASHVRK